MPVTDWDAFNRAAARDRLEAFAAQLRDQARLHGLTPAADGPRGPWAGPDAARAEFFHGLWKAWCDLQIERNETWHVVGNQQAGQQAAIIAVLGGAARQPTADGRAPGVAEFAASASNRSRTH